ncbi:hypothetical protein [Maridesulfovibrio sp. FT414]|uniref:hypothetical protein n=1 Tax=Maridesulfovibrio sp. FT414 TaxID=2979469 RepID=UPI003D809DFA
MPVINRMQNRSDRPGQGLGPCGAGQARGRAAGGRGMNGTGGGMRSGMGRRNGMCRFATTVRTDAQYEESLESRIIELEEENRRLREQISE